MDTLREIDRILYKLRREYGNSITIRIPTRSPNYQTGTITETYESWTVRKAIVLSTNKFTQLLAKLGGWDQSGRLELSDKKVIINKSDLQNHEIPNDAEVVIDSEVFKVIEHVHTYSNKGIVIYLKRTES